MSKSIMIQGTSSNCGKSLITAALCRIFFNMGYSVAPFKSQNMALNSFVTKQGLEIGRAQAMQSEAACIEPDVRMNPILLKPTGESISQVIINGKPFGNMPAAEYFKTKKSFIPYIKDAYNSLADQNDIIVIEGAGSPAEINLKQNDIVNMGMAEIADCPVIIVGDIDRGGVFASLYGTVELLEPNERQRVKGFIINKFRGDINILKPGLEKLYELTKIPVIGVVPYANIDIDDEDSLSERINKNELSIINVSVVKLPHISNFTDFSPFERIEGVGVSYATKPEHIQNSDIIIIPGSKNVIQDLIYIRQNGIEAKIKYMASKGTPIIGICGGYQIMGKKISDPFNYEYGGSIEGIGIFDCETVFNKEKHTKQLKGVVSDFAPFGISKMSFEGYEIHMGETQNNAQHFSQTDQNVLDGAVKGNCFGTYVHGIFDNDNITEQIVKYLFEQKGIHYDSVKHNSIDTKSYKQTQYDKLANLVKSSVNIDKIIELIF